MKRDFHPSDIPRMPGVYIYRDWTGKVIYVGKAANLRHRMSSYFQPGRIQRADAKLRSLIASIDDFSYQTVRSEDEALILESRLIKAYAPYYNILMRDDKRYLLLKIDLSERFPTLVAARVRKEDNARYFGPFPHGSALHATLEFLLAHFGLRACRTSEPDAETRKRCLKRIVKDCCAPCVGAVSPEEYRRRVDAMLEILEGDTSELRAKLAADMAAAAGQQKFERAGKLRDALNNLETVFGRRNRSFENASIVSAYDGPSAVKSLQEKLGIAHPPERIEGFDISNLLGKLAVASCVVFTGGRPDRERYRRFRIKTVFQSDDFAMMDEVLRRRYGRLLRENLPFPDLIMVDGGKGQLHAALDALAEIGAPPLPVIGLAKRNEEIYIPGRSEPLVLDRHDPALRMLQALRDEAHRFAITFHRELRMKRLEESILDEIPNIGPERKKQLLTEFGSIKQLRAASAPEIAERVPGIGEALAQKILDKLDKPGRETAL